MALGDGLRKGLILPCKAKFGAISLFLEFSRALGLWQRAEKKHSWEISLKCGVVLLRMDALGKKAATLKGYNWTRGGGRVAGACGW